MRTDSGRAGLAPANLALRHSLLASVVLHIGLFASLGGHQQGQSALQPSASQGLQATLTHQPSGASFARVAEPLSGASHVESKQSTALPSPEKKAPSAGYSQAQPPALLNIIDAPPLHYYTQKELDIPPYILNELLDEIPAFIENEASGHIVLSLWINDRGQIDQVELIESNLPDEFGKKILDTFAKTPFVAGKKDGHAVHSRTRMELRFGPTPLRQVNERPKQLSQRLVPLAKQ